MVAVTPVSRFDREIKAPDAAKAKEAAVEATRSTITYEQAHAKLMGLGEKDIFRQHIDGRDHDSERGALVYDYDRPAGRGEWGYWNSSLKAIQMSGSPEHLMKGPTVESYKALQATACAHFNVQGPEQGGKESIGVFLERFGGDIFGGKNAKFYMSRIFCTTPEENEARDDKYYRCKLYEHSCPRPPTSPNTKIYETEFERFKRQNPKAYDKDATVEKFCADCLAAHKWLEEFRCDVGAKVNEINFYIRTKSEELGLDEPVAVIKPDPTHRWNANKLWIIYQISQDKIEPTVKRLFEKYNNDMEEATSDEQRLRLIAELFQMLEWIHPFSDGQGRTDLILLNKELCRWGFNPAILEDPYVSTSCTLDEWVGYLKMGMAKWRQKAEEIRAKAITPKVATTLLD